MGEGSPEVARPLDELVGRFLHQQLLAVHHRDDGVGMPEVISAVEQEYRKLGRLVLEREFGGYLSLLR